MFGLFREDVDESEFSIEAQWYLDGIRKGEPHELAARRAGVSPDEVQQWANDRKFKLALKRARRGRGFANVYTADGLGGSHGPIPADRTTYVGADGSVTIVSNAAPPDKQLAPRVQDAGALTIPPRQWHEYLRRTEAGEPHHQVLAEIRERLAASPEPPSVVRIERAPTHSTKGTS